MPTHHITINRWIYDDGGREDAGYQGKASDCVTRAIAIATGQPYQIVYDALNAIATCEHKGRRKCGISNARTGVYRYAESRYLAALGWEWVPTMHIGSGCTVHLRADELPHGPIICSVSKHLVAVLDGMIHDTHDCSRAGTRCVYGYYQKKAAPCQPKL